MKFWNKTAEFANHILMALVLVLALAMSLYGLYVLCDIFYINQTAFVSHDLLQYRPSISTDGESEDNSASLGNLKSINSDTVGWVEIFDTHINYPVVQGKDDLEYLNKDIYGNSTLTGSIYLASDNNSDFNDWYNLLYGHHMDNGAMFGDISKFLDQDYFQTHKKGILQTQSGTYVLNVFACISTDSYEGTIYHISEDAEERYPKLKEYISNHSYQLTEIPDDARILAFSTCTDATTNGRIVLFADVKKMEAAEQQVIAKRTAEEQTKQPAVKKLTAAIGKISLGSQWAALNLVCVLYTLLTLFPIFGIRRKYRQFRFSKKTSQDLSTSQEQTKRTEEIIRDLRGFVRKMRVGFFCEAVLFLAAAVVFLLTEDIGKSVILYDEWTWLMVLMAAGALAIDFICFRYRGIRPEP